jgi:hypothetical protein
MSDSHVQTQETHHILEPIIISAFNPAPQIERTVRICWNTGDEKNCPGCYLGKSCKAKT